MIPPHILKQQRVGNNVTTKTRRSFTTLHEAFSVFSPQTNEGVLQNLVTKDLVTPPIQHSLLQAQMNGQQQVARFVADRLMKNADQAKQLKFHDLVKLNKSATFATLYEVKADKGKSCMLIGMCSIV